MLDYNDLAQAAFDNDARSDEGVALHDIFERDLNISLLGIRRAAQQRALRMVIMQRGPREAQRVREQAYMRQFSIEKLSGQEKAMADVLTAMWIDAAATTARALKTEETND